MNVIIVSDHGMADSPQGQKLVDLAKYVPDMQNSALTFLGPVTSIRPLKDTQGKLYSHHMYINVDISNKKCCNNTLFCSQKKKSGLVAHCLAKILTCAFSTKGNCLIGCIPFKRGVFQISCLTWTSAGGLF